MKDIITKSIEIAARIHNGQTDKAGLPYILHPWEVAIKSIDNVFDDDVRAHIWSVAMLHDSIEDFEGTKPDKVDFVAELYREFGSYIVIDILTLTRKTGKEYKDTHGREEYKDYIQRIIDSGSSIAKRVKISDILHNSDLSRVAHLPFDGLDRNRQVRYAEALKDLKNTQ